MCTCPCRPLGGDGQEATQASRSRPVSVPGLQKRPCMVVCVMVPRLQVAVAWLCEIAAVWGSRRGIRQGHRCIALGCRGEHLAWDVRRQSLPCSVTELDTSQQAGAATAADKRQSPALQVRTCMPPLSSAHMLVIMLGNCTEDGSWKLVQSLCTSAQSVHSLLRDAAAQPNLMAQG